jgi:hypothetical protein
MAKNAEPPLMFAFPWTVAFFLGLSSFHLKEIK